MKFRPDWFLIGIAVVSGLAWLFPAPGAQGGWLHPEILTKGGVALIFFLHGALLAFSSLKAGALNWRLHLFVQTCTFLVFPLLGVLTITLLGGAASAEVKLGIFYLCALPSTVSSSIAMTATARGNVAGAVFNATLSSLLGILATPLWVAAVLRTAGQPLPFWPVVLDLCLWLLLPLTLGQLVRPVIGAWLARHRARVSLVDRGTILLLVYTSMCESFRQGIWLRQGVAQLLVVAGICAVLLVVIFLLTSEIARRLGFTREDRIAAVFCGSKKTLASGVPMANLIFGSHPGIGLILLPIMIYHPLQLVVGGVLAQRWGAKEAKH